MTIEALRIEIVDDEPANVIEIVEGAIEVVELVIEGPQGAPGAQGPSGAPGYQGVDGKSAYQIAVDNGFVGSQQAWLDYLNTGDVDLTFGFASPQTTWHIYHNQNTYALIVETVDHNGQSIEGNVVKVSPTQIDVHFYYPTAGTARVYR